MCGQFILPESIFSCQVLNSGRLALGVVLNLRAEMERSSFQFFFQCKFKDTALSDWTLKCDFYF